MIPWFHDSMIPWLPSWLTSHRLNRWRMQRRRSLKILSIGNEDSSIGNEECCASQFILSWYHPAEAGARASWPPHRISLDPQLTVCSPCWRYRRSAARWPWLLHLNHHFKYKFHHFNTNSIIFNTEFIILNTKFTSASGTSQTPFSPGAFRNSSFVMKNWSFLMKSWSSLMQDWSFLIQNPSFSIPNSSFLMQSCIPAHPAVSSLVHAADRRMWFILSTTFIILNAEFIILDAEFIILTQNPSFWMQSSSFWMQNSSFWMQNSSF